MVKKNVEARVTGDVLKFFCIENKDFIVGCEWYQTKYCLRTCKFYLNKQGKMKEQAKYWNRGVADNSTYRK